MLIDKDYLGLWYVGRFGQMRVESLRRVLGRGRTDGDVLSDRRTRGAIKKWEREGYAQFRKLQESERKWVCLTAKGMKAVALPYRAGYAVRDPFLLGHSFEVTELILKLEDTYGDDLRFLTERELYHRHGREQECPDGLLEIMQGGGWWPVALEVELTAKSAKRMDVKLEALAQHYQNIWYYVHKPTQGVVLQAVRRMRQSGVNISVYDVNTWEEYT